MDEWQHDETARDTSKGEGCGFNCIAYLWIVPAKVGGNAAPWRAAR